MKKSALKVHAKGLDAIELIAEFRQLAGKLSHVRTEYPDHLVDLADIVPLLADGALYTLHVEPTERARKCLAAFLAVQTDRLSIRVHGPDAKAAHRRRQAKKPTRRAG